MTNDQSYNGLHYNNGNYSTVNDTLAIEESLSISLNGESFTVTMRTPGEDDALVRGLLFTEEVYRDINDEPLIDNINTNDKGFVVSLNVVLPPDKILKDFTNTRNIISASSCGLCGRTSFEDTISKNIITEKDTLNPNVIEKMFDRMSQHQESFRRTGGTHAAAAFTLNGDLLSIHEDIGRHNAVDKVIGSLVIDKKLQKAKCMIVSGRISYEIVNKALSAGIPFVAAVSAPSSMAVENAQNAGMTLMAFCRKSKLTVYAHPERLEKDEPVQLNEK